MTEPAADLDPAYADHDEISLLALGSVLLSWRRTIIAFGFLGAIVGLAKGLTSTRVYVSTATFIPQGSDAGASGLAMAASQFGIRIPTTSGGAWQPPVYVELLRSQTLLGRIAQDTVVVAERGGRRVAIMDLLEIDAPTPARRTDIAVRALRDRVKPSEDRKLNAVKLSVTTPWPSVSLALAERLVRGVGTFNLETRKSQAAAERQFVEAQALAAEKDLREAEDRLQVFLQRNRVTGAPELAFQKDRLEREVALRQQVFNSLLQNREEARIREVRDTPVITVLEEPRLPSFGEPRRSVLKGLLGGVVGLVMGILVAFVAREFKGARRAPTDEAQEFFKLLEEATPRFLRRRKA